MCALRLGTDLRRLLRLLLPRRLRLHHLGRTDQTIFPRHLRQCIRCPSASDNFISGAILRVADLCVALLVDVLRDLRARMALVRA